MTRKRAKELLPIIQAFADGKIIQIQNDRNEWVRVCDPSLHELGKCRVKPEPREFWLFRDSKEEGYRVKPKAPELDWMEVIRVREILTDETP